MGKTKAKKKSKLSVFKQIALTLGLASMVAVIAFVVIKTINKTTIKTVTVEGAYSELYIGNPELGSVTIGTSVYPETANKSSLVAYSKNPEIATVEFDGETLTISAKGVGTTEIYLQHSSKSSLYDKVEICVKDVDIQSITFGNRDDEGTLTPLTAVDMKKDGFEHVIPFDLDPFNGNMNNLKISDFNQDVFQSVKIDQNKRALVVVPKTDIVQTSAIVDVEIFQNTTEGYSAVQVVSLMVNLKNREAFVNFELSSTKEETGFTTLNYVEENALKNIVYLETATAGARDVYVRPIIGYDINFESSGEFNEADYNLYYDGQKIESTDFDAEGSYNYKNKLKISKNKGNYYYFETLNLFNEDDAIYVVFEHKYTGAKGGIQFIRLDVESIGLGGSQPFGVYDTNGEIRSNGGVIELEEQDVFSLNFTYDAAIDSEIIHIETYKEVEVGGKKERVYTDTFGDALHEETIKIKKDNKKLSVWTRELTNETIIHFAASWNYWDARYVRISPDTNIGIKFVIRSKLTGLHIEKDGKETNYETIAKGSAIEVVLVAEPAGGNFDVNDATIVIKKDGVQTEHISAGVVDGVVVVYARPDAVNGTYEVIFEYNGVQTTLYVTV